MKIVIATAVYYPMTNGVAVFSYNLAKGLAQRGHEVLVITPSTLGDKYTTTEDKVIVKHLKSLAVPFYPDQVNGDRGFPVSLLPSQEINDILNNFHPDIIHCQTADPVGLAAAKYARQHHIPLVTTEHNYPDVIVDQLKLPPFLAKPASQLIHNYLVKNHRKSDYVTMPTELAIEDLIIGDKQNFKAPIEAISNGVDLSNFHSGKASDQIYHKYNIPQGRPTALYVGRIDPEKQVGLVIEAFSQVLPKIPEAILVIVGDGTEKKSLEKLADHLNIKKSIIFTGKITPPELYEVYRVGNVFVTASEIETQGIVLIEAAASGLPLVAVNKGAINEVCKNGENGALCHPKNTTEIANGLTKILTDKKLQQKYSKASLAIAKQHDINNTLDRFEKIYQNLTKSDQTSSAAS